MKAVLLLAVIINLLGGWAKVGAVKNKPKRHVGRRAHKRGRHNPPHIRLKRSGPHHHGPSHHTREDQHNCSSLDMSCSGVGTCCNTTESKYECQTTPEGPFCVIIVAPVTPTVLTNNTYGWMCASATPNGYIDPSSLPYPNNGTIPEVLAIIIDALSNESRPSGTMTRTIESLLEHILRPFGLSPWLVRQAVDFLWARANKTNPQWVCELVTGLAYWLKHVLDEGDATGEVFETLKRTIS